MNLSDEPGASDLQISLRVLIMQPILGCDPIAFWVADFSLGVVVWSCKFDSRSTDHHKLKNPLVTEMVRSWTRLHLPAAHPQF